MLNSELIALKNSVSNEGVVIELPERTLQNRMNSIASRYALVPMPTLKNNNLQVKKIK